MPRKPSGSFSPTGYKREYNEKAYDRLNLVIPKGRKKDVEALAQKRNLSVNKMVSEFFRTELGMSEQEWKQSPLEPEQ